MANAIEHGEGQPIEVRVAADDQAVAVAVRDHGVGLRAGEAVGMVFNRFWRADPARARTTGGTGLGLSIALEDAHLHDGWLQAWGEPGDGCQFRLTVPAAARRRAGGLADPAGADGLDQAAAPGGGRAAVPAHPQPRRRRCLNLVRRGPPSSWCCWRC